MRVPTWLAALTTRRGKLLPVSRASARVSAFAYGNILVLAVVIGAGPGVIEDGSAAVLVLGTTVSTYFAHIFADWLAHGVQQGAEDKVAAGRNDMNFAAALRDAVPIISSGILPIIFLTMGYLEVLSVITAQLCAAGGIILRLGVLGLVIERVQSTKVSWRPLAAGVGVAAVAAIVTVVKVVLTH